jgi:hypothetical protein
MIEMSLMSPSKETENKLRWVADVDGIPFQLYIPKWRVPTQWPNRIRVFISELSDPQSSRSSVVPKDPIVVVVERVSEHTQTVRFAPEGDPKEWQVGEPYIPYGLLPTPTSNRLRLEIEWDTSAGTWDR